MPPHDDLPIFVQWLEFLTWLLQTTEKFPKRVRFTITQRIENLALDIVELLVEARYTQMKKDLLKNTNLKLEKLRILLRICHQQHYLATSSYEFASKQLLTIGNMLGGWIKQQNQ